MILLVSISLSCAKENVSTKAKSNFLTAIKKGYSGVGKIENTKVGFSTDKRRCLISGKFTKELNPILGKLSFNDKTLNLGEKKFQERSIEHADLFGRKVDISFETEKKNPIETAFYVPEVINIDFVSEDENDKPIFSAGSNLSWNADKLNSMGVSIVINYEPSFNHPKIGEQKLTRTENFIHTDDTGNYIFKSEDLSDIPDSAVVFVRIIRGNYRVVEADSEEYLFFGISEAQGFAIKNNR